MRPLRKREPGSGIIILTMYKRDAYVLEAIKAGASGYMLKEVELEELLAAIRAVAQGDAVIDPAIAGRVLNEIRGVKKAKRVMPEAKLADKDLEILKLVGQGLSNQEIADKLFLSEKTIRNRLSQVFRQLDLKNRTEAALFALRKGLVDQEDVN